MKKTIICITILSSISLQAFSMEKEERIQEEYNKLAQQIALDKRIEEYRLNLQTSLVEPFEYKKIALDRLIVDQGISGTPLAEKYKNDLVKEKEGIEKQVDRLTHEFRLNEKMRVAKSQNIQPSKK